MNFSLCYRALTETSSGWGRLAIVPWDTEIFGFTVADYEAGIADTVRAELAAWRSAFREWTAAHSAKLVSCGVASEDMQWMTLLPKLGFCLVDYSLRVTLPRLQTAKLPPARVSVRLAEPHDQASIERIATTAFRFGRYHTDPLMPPELAARRYEYWIRNAFADLQENRIYVLGPPQAAIGFFHVVIRDGIADLRLGAVDAHAGGLAGYSLYLGTFKALQQDHVKRATAKISAANVAVMNLYATCGFQFSNPEATFHWHALAID